MTAPAPTPAGMLDESVIEPGRAFAFYAPVGAPAPTKADIDAFDPNSPDRLSTRSGMNVWLCFGNTDLEEDFEADQDGGDSETRGTRQNPELRERVEATVEYLQLNLVEFRNRTARLYYGGGTSTVAGQFDAPDNPGARDYATTIVYIDGDERRVAEYHPKTSIRRNGPVARAAEGFMRFPIRLTWLKAAGQPITRWIGEHFGDGVDEE